MISIFKIRFQHLKRHSFNYIGYFLIPSLILIICVPGVIIKYTILNHSSDRNGYDDDDYYSFYKLYPKGNNFYNKQNYTEKENTHNESNKNFNYYFEEKNETYLEKNEKISYIQEYIRNNFLLKYKINKISDIFDINNIKRFFNWLYFQKYN